MSKPSKPAPDYVSPVVLAGDILARARAGERVSKQAHSTALRIAALPSEPALRLATHRAPYRVAAWVAWAKLPIDVYKRADLAVLLRRARPSKGWPDTAHLKVAFDVFVQARVARYGVGGMAVLMEAEDVPVEQYTAAIDALPKRRRVARPTAAAEESSALPAIVNEDDVLRALVEARPRRARPPAIKLRTTPLRTDAKPAASPSEELERAQAENARLRALRERDELEAERHKDFLRREIERLTAKNEHLEREIRARSGGPPKWLVGLGGVVVGAAATELVRRKLELSEAGDARDREGAQSPGERPTAPSATAGPLDGEGLLGRLLPVFDNLARAQQHAEMGTPAAAIADGLRMVRGQLDEALARSGVERVPTVGQLFDPAKHAAVEHVDATEPAGVVLREVLPGYMAGGRLLRAPSVVVSKGPPPG